MLGYFTQGAPEITCTETYCLKGETVYYSGNSGLIAWNNIHNPTM